MIYITIQEIFFIFTLHFLRRYSIFSYIYKEKIDF